MLIECHIKRRNEKTGQVGTTVTLDGIDYLFVPTAEDPDGPHVCEVGEPKHLAILLKIDECYTAAGEPLEAKATAPAPSALPAFSEIDDPDAYVDPGDENNPAVQTNYAPEISIEMQMLDTIVDMTVEDAKAEIAGVAEELLPILIQKESAARDRSTLIAAIRDEIEVRAEIADSTDVVASEEIAGIE